MGIESRIPIAVGSALLLFGLAAFGQDPSPTDLDWLRGEAIDGALAYESQDEIYLTELSTGATENVGAGSQVEFSPDSSKLAWIDGTTAKGRMRSGDTTVHTIATGVTAEGGVHWVSNTEVVVVKSAKWYRVSLDGNETEVLALTALGTGGSECDVKLGSDGVWSYVTGATWKTSDGQTGSTGGSCSCSLSPDSRSVTGLEHGHKSCQLTQIRSGGVDDALSWVYDFTGEKGFDNHRWSSNDPRFVACQDEKYNYMVVMKVGGTYCTRMGEQGGGEMYGDFSVGDSAGDPWPGTVSDPLLLLSPGYLSFSAIAGGNDPPAASVSVSNVGGGVLDAVSTTVVYNDGANWLTVTASGSGNSQSLETQTSVSGLSAGTYSAQVEVDSANAINTPATYDVSLTVGTQPTLTSLVIEPATITILASQSTSFTARGLDQSGDPISADLSWSVSAGGNMNPTSSGGPVVEHSSTFASDGSQGTFVVQVTSSGLTAMASVAVVTEADIHLKINCGDDAFTPDGWDQDGPYLSGGVDFVFADVFDTTGVSNAAPAEVYQTCRHRIRDVEVGYGYDFSALPDGDYLVRLHFGDGHGPRSIDVWIEGQEVVSDLDIVTEAGGQYRALVRDVPVTLADGDGLQIELTDDRANPEDVFINGIEIIGQGNRPPTVDAGADQIVQLGTPVFLDGTVSDDGKPGGPVTVLWSVPSGPDQVTIQDEAAIDTQVDFASAGAYTLRLTADDGDLESYDEVDILVTQQASIDLISPDGNEILTVGTVHPIRWTTVALDDVQIDYSIDDGQTWTNIAGSVDTANPDWGSYPWTVPDEPTSQGRVRIAGYFGEAPVSSAGPFTIRRAEEDGVEGSCGCGAGGKSGVFLLVLGLMGLGLRRRPDG